MSDVKPFEISALRPKDIKRFWSKVKMLEGDAQVCWEWQGTRINNRYGQFGAIAAYGRSVLAHRISYMLAHGQISDPQLLVLHRCDNPPCVNPAHLFLGTHLENAIDSKHKGRRATGERNGALKYPDTRARGLNNGAYTHPETRHYGYRNISRRVPGIRAGTNNGRAKLDAACVKVIRAACLAGGIQQKDLAKRFGVSESAVSFVVLRKTWKHVE